MVTPLHSVVFCDRAQLDLFPVHERISLAAIAYDLVGDTAVNVWLPTPSMRDLRAIAFVELRHRLSLKLSLGQRVAVLADDLLASQRRQLTTLAISQGSPVIETGALPLVQPLPDDPLEVLRENWRGITLVGDVHGDLAAMTTACRWAEARGNFVLFMGDVIDYGSDTLATSDAVYERVMAGTAGMILGNHERKIARWLDQCENGKPNLRLNAGNRVTIDALNALKQPARKQWIGRFRGLLSHAALIRRIGGLMMLHGAAHPTLWEQSNADLIEQFALYGEADHSSGKYRRSHRWIDAIPRDQMVFVGHDVIGEFPTIMTGANGGRVVFLDTGCGKGGYLSTADLRFGDNGLRLECFNRH